MAAFHTLSSLPSELLKTLDSLGFEQMTQIQSESIPAIMEGRDLIAQL